MAKIRIDKELVENLPRGIRVRSPKDREEANRALIELGSLIDGMRGIASKADRGIAEIERTAARRIQSRRKRAIRITVGLKRYWDAQRIELTGDSTRKSAKIGSGTIGERKGKPKVNTGGMSDEEVIEMIRKRGMLKALTRRQRRILDRIAMIREENRDRVSRIPGVEIYQDEFFFAKPFSGTADMVREVEEEEGGFELNLTAK